MAGNTGENLLVLLERRLDNAVFALGFTTSRRGARQLVTHGHVTVNGRRCDVPSAQLRPGDRVGVGARESLRKSVKDSLEQRSSYPMPAWLERDGAALEGRVTAVPSRTDVSFDVREQLIVELMSK
jgi:small subunit ribosomal protein S4